MHGLSSTGRLTANSALNRAETSAVCPCYAPFFPIASYSKRQPPIQVILNSVANAVYLPTLFILKLLSLVRCLVIFHYVHL